MCVDIMIYEDVNISIKLSLWLSKNASKEGGVAQELNDTNIMFLVRGMCLLLFTALGAMLNVFMLVAIIPNRRLRTVRNILLVHLAGVGLAMCILITLYSAVVNLEGEWLGGTEVCYAYGFVQCVLTTLSVWTIAALSWDKYQTIASPLHHSVTARLPKMATMFGALWTVAIILSLPPTIWSAGFNFHSVIGVCSLGIQDNHKRWYSLIYVFVSFYVPLFVMAYSYIHIFRIARTQSSRIAATMLRMTSVIQAPVTSGSPSSYSVKGRKAMNTILQLLGSFVLSYIPYSVVILIETCIGYRGINHIIMAVVVTIFQAAPITNALVYGLRNKILRSSFRRYIKRNVQHACYKDRRRGSVKSLSRRGSTLRMSFLIRRAEGNSGTLRRTSSVPVKSMSEYRKQFQDRLSIGPIHRAHSFNTTGEALKNDGSLPTLV